MGRVKEWFKKWLYFSKATLCIRGLVFSHSIVDHAIVDILILYLVLNWKKEHFQIAAVVTNLQDGFADIMVIFLAHFASTYRRYYNMILTTNAAYIAGLAILWRAADYMTPGTAAKVYYLAVLLIIIGEAGRVAFLKEFLDEQYSRERDQSIIIEDETLVKRQKALWDLPRFLGSCVPPLLFNTINTWGKMFMLSTIVMAVFLLIFYFGHFFYFIKRSDPLVLQQIDEAGRKESVANEESAEPTRGNFRKLVKLISSKKERHLRKQIVSVWLTFLVFSVINAAGNTFFYSQMSNLRQPIDIYNIAVYFNLITSFSSYAVNFLWGSMVSKNVKTRPKTLVRIGCGLASSVVCIAIAWRVELRRLREVKILGAGHIDDEVPMSIFRLVPQFSLLGISQGLLVDGLIDFFVERVASDNDKVMVQRYADQAGVFVIGVGKILTALSILAFRSRWFDDTVNMSRLDRYYRALTFLSIVGFFYYLCVSVMYYTKARVQDSTEQQEHETDVRV